MSEYTISVRIDRGYEAAVEETRAALSDQGFGILTEIDLSGTLKEKIDVDVPRQVILGACRPPLAHEAITAEPAIATVLPCNVLVREVEEGASQVEAFDPHVMTQISSSDALHKVAEDARQRLQAALDSLA